MFNGGVEGATSSSEVMDEWTPEDGLQLKYADSAVFENARRRQTEEIVH